MEADHFVSTKAFSGKTVFITGGGSGINMGIADHFAAAGARVAICGRTASRLEDAATALRSHGGEVLPVVADVRDFDAMVQAMEVCRQQLGSIDVLVCGAAGNFLCPAEKMTPNGFKTVVEIDLIGSFNASRAAFEQLQETKGSILFISAGQSFIPFENQAHAGAAKAGIDNLMRNLAFEWGRYGIRANSIAPGFIHDTTGVSKISGPNGVSGLVKDVPLGRLGSKTDVAHVALFLSSPMSSYVTGSTVVVDGGYYLGGSRSLSLVKADV